VLPDSLLEFWCSYNEIISFAGLTLPDSLLEFWCSYNKITSFAGLTLPKSLIKFDCSRNQITSYFVDNGLAGLALPESLIEFDCSNNQIKSFTGLTLPDSLKEFYCSINQITVIEDFIFPSNLTILGIDLEVKFVSPKFNSVLRRSLNNNVEFTSLDYDHLLFLYLNFKSLSYQQYNEILKQISHTK
jgi:hypothetical protein